MTEEVVKEVKTEDDPVVEKKASTEDIAKEVIAGHWGRGRARDEKLQAAGYDPGKVHKQVLKILGR